MNTKSPLPYIIAGAAGAMVASVMPFLFTTSHADTKLLPFQGRLTDAAGTAIADGAKVVEFKMYDAPNGGNVKWAGEVHKLSINGGLVNTMLGSKATLGSVDFSTPCYLQITVDANTDNQITAADPPLLPRQSVIPAIFAMETQQARGLQWTNAQGVVQGSSNWSALFGAGQDPATSNVPLNRVSIPTGSIPATSIAANDAVSANQLAPNSVETSELKNSSVTFAKLASIASSNAAVLGGLAVSTAEVMSDEFIISSTPTAYPGLRVTLQTNGGPVFIGIIGGELLVNVSGASLPGAFPACEYMIFRDGIKVASSTILTDSSYTRIPISLLQIDNPTAGAHTYEVKAAMNAGRPGSTSLRGGKIFAYEMR